MRVETTYDADGVPSHTYIFEPSEVAVMTGPVTGIKTLADGTAVDVGAPYVLVENQEQADELAHLIALEHVEKGNPNDVDHLVDPETGKTVPVQRPFVYETPDGEVLVGAGVAHGDHPLDEANNITSADADPRIAAAADATTTTKEG